MRIWQRRKETDYRMIFWSFIGIYVFGILAVAFFNLFEEMLIGYDKIFLLSRETCVVGADNRFMHVYPEHPAKAGFTGSVSPFEVSPDSCADGGALHDALAAPRTGVSGLLTAEGAVYIPGETYYLISEHSARLGTFSLSEGVPLAGDYRYLEKYEHAPAASLALYDAESVSWAKPLPFMRGWIMGYVMPIFLILLTLTPLLSLLQFVIVGAMNLASGLCRSFRDLLGLLGETCMVMLVVSVIALFGARVFSWGVSEITGEITALPMIPFLFIILIPFALAGYYSNLAYLRFRPQAARLRRGALALYQKYHGDYKFAA